MPDFARILRKPRKRPVESTETAEDKISQSSELGWYAWQGSNLRPSVPETTLMFSACFSLL